LALSVTHDADFGAVGVGVGVGVGVAEADADADCVALAWEIVVLAPPQAVRESAAAVDAAIAKNLKIALRDFKKS
jgi:hypothetical protein